MLPATDVHQHVWTPGLLAALRGRTAAPRLVGDQLITEHEPPFTLRADDLAARRELAASDGLDRVLLAPSSPLGLEYLPEAQAAELLGCWQAEVLALGAPFAAWAGVPLAEPDALGLRTQLAAGCIGLQLPATALAEPAGWEACGVLLAELEAADRPLLVHPGVAPPTGRTTPGWWPALVGYVQQLHAAWYAFTVAGRSAHPRLRVCFAALAGLAPLHAERLAARGGRAGAVDPLVFLETSSYGARAVDAVGRALGLDVLVHGSDRPYAQPAVLDLDEAAVFALRRRNPHQLVEGAR